MSHSKSSNKSNPKIYVADSPIHGKGLFAKAPIKAGELIGMLQGKKTKRNGDHVLWVNDEYGIHVQCDFRYINHNPKPNACYYDTLEIIALKDIAVDEEITHDYQWD